MYFKQCPFCDEVFDIGATDHQLVEVHIAEKHREEGAERIDHRQRDRFSPRSAPQI